MQWHGIKQYNVHLETCIDCPERAAMLMSGQPAGSWMALHSRCAHRLSHLVHTGTFDDTWCL